MRIPGFTGATGGETRDSEAAVERKDMDGQNKMNTNFPETKTHQCRLSRPQTKQCQETEQSLVSHRHHCHLNRL